MGDAHEYQGRKSNGKQSGASAEARGTSFWANPILCEENISFTGFRWVFFNHDLSLVPSSMAMNKIALTKKMLVSLDREGIVKRKLWKISPG